MFPFTCPHCRKRLYTVAEATAHLDEHPDEKRAAQGRADATTDADVRRITLGVVLDAAVGAGILNELPPPPPPPPPIVLW